MPFKMPSKDYLAALAIKEVIRDWQDLKISDKYALFNIECILKSHKEEKEKANAL